jgi:hypothetical protein
MNDMHEMNDDQQTNQEDSGDLSSVVGQGDYSFVTTEQKKPMNRTMLVLVAALILGGGGLFVMKQRSGPSTATAAATKSESAAASKAINQFLDDGGKNLKLMEELLHNTEKVVEQFHNYPSVTQIPLSDLQKNPFRFADTTDDRSTKASDTAAAKKREEERLAALKAFNALTLQTIMHGETRRSCMINNTLVREGQQVNGFVVERIQPNNVTVRMGEYRFDLAMQR